jgi:integrase/recombinase XerD
LARAYLVEVKTDLPSPQDAADYHDALHQKKLSKTAMNNFAAAITKYQEMIKKPVKLPFLKTTKKLPYFFDEMDILKLFSVCKNIKHLCMLKVLFYGCLRSGELCNLDVEDYDPKNLTLRLRETKNGTDALSYINDETAKLLNQYLKVRPSLEVDGHEPLFYTDYGHRWTNGDIHRMFATYKESAGIEKKGGPHVFSRHSSATLMIAQGCDLRTVQSILRHKDINTTLRYTHLTDKTKREKYEKFMKL